MSRARFLVLAAVGALALAGCSKQGTGTEATPECFCTGDPVVDRALVAFLSKARAAHHQADAAQEAGDTKKAIAALEGLVRGPRPGKGRDLAPEVAEVIADTQARLADLRSEAGEFEAAQKDVEEGLALAQKPTHFRGHLFEVKGIVLERWAKVLKERGDSSGSEMARGAAVEAFEMAIKIQDQVISEALPGKP